MGRIAIQVDEQPPEVWYADHYFTEEWHCPQPNRYRVLRDEWIWDGKYYTRHVHDVQEVTQPE